MSAFVVDTNVPVVANGQHPQAGLRCQLACIQRLIKIKESGVVVLDQGMDILEEYRGYLSFSGEPGVGDEFFRWLWDVQGLPDHCEKVPLTPRGGAGDYEEFPENGRLGGFHIKDRKFVAVALTSALDPTVLNAVDSDWWIHRVALTRAGIRIEFVCPEVF